MVYKSLLSFVFFTLNPSGFHVRSLHVKKDERASKARAGARIKQTIEHIR